MSQLVVQVNSCPRGPPSSIGRHLRLRSGQHCTPLVSHGCCDVPSRACWRGDCVELIDASFSLSRVVKRLQAPTLSNQSWTSMGHERPERHSDLSIGSNQERHPVRIKLVSVENGGNCLLSLRKFSERRQCLSVPAGGALLMMHQPPCAVLRTILVTSQSCCIGLRCIGLRASSGHAAGGEGV